MHHLDDVSRNCLHGLPPPDDLRRLWQVNDDHLWLDYVPFRLVDKLADDFFTGYRETDGVSPQVVIAYQKMFEHIAFVGKREDGELVGYWLGPENRSPSDSPIVELDTEGQFDLLGRNLAEYLLACVNSEDDFIQLRKILVGSGFTITAETQTDLLQTLDGLQKDFGNPNRVSRRYQKGMEAPRPSNLRFGTYHFPDAGHILRQLGIDDLTANSTQKAVIQRLGTPDQTGGGIKIAALGYINPWIKYQRSDCQLRFEFDRDMSTMKVTLLEPDWEPGM
jgi:hypothetical protein